MAPTRVWPACNSTGPRQGRLPPSVPGPLPHTDAFTAEPFRGNAAAVCLLPAAREVAWMRGLAAELNLPATAFVVGTDNEFALRWFTPSAELQLCGHGTLAAAHALWETRRLAPDATTRFTTGAGTLAAARRDGWISLDFPAEPATRTRAPAGLAEALGVKAGWVGRNRLAYVAAGDRRPALRALSPDFPALTPIDTRGVIA